MGLSIGWASPALLQLLPQMQLTPSQEGWLGGLLPLGGLLAAPFAPLLLHRVGRRGTLLFSCLPMLAGWACLTVPCLPLLYIGRLLTGLASSWLATTVPVYIGEVACPHLRGTLAALFQVSVLEVISINVHKMIQVVEL